VQPISKASAKRTYVAVLAVLFGISMALAGGAAAAPPQIASTAVTSVTATSVALSGAVNPNGVATTYRFEYLTLAAYEANLAAQPAREPFAGGVVPRVRGTGSAGVGTSPNTVSAPVSELAPETAYRYRLVATNSANESVATVARPFATQPPTNAFELLDHRGWEMVSPIEKAGGAIQPPGAISGGGVFQAAAGGGLFTFSSADSFGTGAQSAPSGSQYLAGRGSTGWVTANISTPILSGSYGSEPDGVPFQLFSGDLGLGLLSNGERCRGVSGGECPVANPPLPGSGASAGYRNYYRRAASGSFESILTPAELAHTSLGPEQFEVRLVAATPDLAHVVLSSCAALTADATEVAAVGGCDPAEQNLYEWSGGALSLVNLLPGESTGTPGAAIAAPSGAISNDGSRVYFTSEGAVYLREGSATKIVSAAPGGKFEGASADGSIAYLVVAERLEKYSATTGFLTPLTLGSGVEGVLGVSADGKRAYYARSGAIFFRDGEALTEIASSALPSDWLQSGETSRVARDGSRLLFLSNAELTGYPSEGKTEVYLYGSGLGTGNSSLACVSCNPTGEKPFGGASIPGVRHNGAGAEALAAYKPRDLSADGNRVFFETTDRLSSQDSNEVVDVYEWEADGAGTCATVGGCIQLISGGRDTAPSYFLDADEDGGEAFFLTAAPLYPLDPGSYDVYDAREGGGFAIPESPIPCVADACQVLPEAPEDTTPGTLVPNSGNPPLTVEGGSKKGGKSKKSKKKKHKKHKKKSARHHAKGKGEGGKK
jgi:hypothetical protein